MKLRKIAAPFAALMGAALVLSSCSSTPPKNEDEVTSSPTDEATGETTEVTIRRFRDVPEDFALAEGEGSFDDWTRGHIDFFTRNGGFDPDMELVCERFRLVEMLA